MARLMGRNGPEDLDDAVVDDAMAYLRDRGMPNVTMPTVAAFLRAMKDSDYAQRELPALEQSGQVPQGLSTMLPQRQGTSAMGAGMLPGGGPSGVPRAGGLPPNPLLMMLPMGAGR